MTRALLTQPRVRPTPQGVCDVTERRCIAVFEGERCESTNIFATGLCHAHYTQIRRHGQPISLGPIRVKDRGCSVVDDEGQCPNPHEGHGLCVKHLTRLKRYGTTDNLWGPKYCQVLEGDEPCGEDAWAREVCGKHYQRWRTHGDPTFDHGYGPIAQDPLERFLKNFDFTVIEFGDPIPCWPFPKLRWDGYGHFQGLTPRGDWATNAHRLAYEWWVGPIPPGLTLDHMCHTRDCPDPTPCRHRRCCNPWHLQPATSKDNQNRTRRERRAPS